VQSVIGLRKLGVLPTVARTQTYVNHFKAARMAKKHPDDLPGAAEITGFYTARNETRSMSKKQSREFTLNHDDARLRDVVNELFPLHQCEAFIPADKHKFFLQAGERVKSMVFTSMGRAFVFKGKGRKGVYSTTDTKISLRCAKNGASHGALIFVPVVVGNKGKVVNKRFLMHRMIAPMTHEQYIDEIDEKKLEIDHQRQTRGPHNISRVPDNTAQNLAIVSKDLNYVNRGYTKKKRTNEENVDLPMGVSYCDADNTWFAALDCRGTRYRSQTKASRNDRAARDDICVERRMMELLQFSLVRE